MKKIRFLFISIFLIISTLSLGQVTIWSENFEGSLSDYTMLSEVSKDCYWGDVSCKSHSGSWSLWCADDGTDAPSTNCSDYPNSMRANVRKTYASYINSDNYSSIDFKFWIWFDIGSGDEIEIYTYDISGQPEWVLKGTLNGDHSWNGTGWHQVSIDLTGMDYFAFKIVFDSNLFSDNEEGVYIDDMELIGTPPIHEVYNAWWSDEVDNNNNNYTQYRKLYFDVDISSGSNEIWAKIWKEKTNGTSGAWYAETSNFTITGNDSGDKQYIEVGIPNEELSYGSYNFGIEVIDSETNSILTTYDWDDDTDLNNEKFETQLEDIPPPDITVTNPSVTPTTVCVGGTIDVSCDHYCTDGSDETPNVGYYLSTNTTCSTSDTYLGDDESSICGSDLYDGESETLTIPTGTNPGTYYVCFIGDYLNEVSESDESNNCQFITITVTPCCSPTSIVTDNSGTGSVTMSCTASGGSGGSYLYKWYSSTSCSGDVLGTNSTLNVTESGYYSCKVYIDGFESTCYDCDYGYATVNSECTAPTSNVADNSGTGSVTMSCTASGGSGGSYLYKWYSSTSCSGDILGTNSTLNVTESGYYSCKVYIDGFESACYDCDYGYGTINPTGINDTEELTSINIYPNPTNGTLIFESDIELDRIEIYNILGGLVYQSKFKPEINISNLNEGIYLLKLFNKGNVNILTQKIMLK